MLTFELSAIDLILVITVIILLLLYWTKLSKTSEQQPLKETTTKNQEKNIQNRYTECPRGFGNIKRISDDGSVSERCLGCYRIMDCYGNNKEEKPQLNTSSQQY